MRLSYDVISSMGFLKKSEWIFAMQSSVKRVCVDITLYADYVYRKSNNWIKSYISLRRANQHWLLWYKYFFK